MQNSKTAAAREHKLIFDGLEQINPSPADDIVEMMDRINDYLLSSYFLAINPLTQLRRILPQYEWKFVQPKNLRQARAVVSTADFVWRTDWFNGPGLSSSSTAEDIERCFPAELAIATLLNRAEPLKHFFAGKKNKSAETTTELEFVSVCGGDAVYFNVVNK
jgi:hypothetical protein